MQANEENTEADDVRADVLRELQHEPAIDAIGIIVTAAAGGAVTLSGVVPTLPQKYAAEQIARRVYGVREVIDALEVRLDPKNRRPDAELLCAARDSLRWNCDVPHDRITVVVENGWITLEGEVDWQYQRQAAASAVRNLTGALGLSNLICVKPTVRVASADVRRGIAETFRRHADLEARRIGVETTEHGKVTLFGNVHNLCEISEAERAAWSVRGVSEVDNRLIVDPSCDPATNL